MIILFTPNNIASRNIAERLVADHGFGKKSENLWERGKTILMETDAPTVLDVPTDFDTDCLVVLSTHKSKADGNMLTAHVPGNWKEAGFGGEPRTLNTAPAGILKVIAKEMAKEAEKISWPFSLEADHHGPTCKAPIIFVEIGNSEKEWNDGQAAGAVAEAVSRAVERIENGIPDYPVAFGIGGGHYSRTFTKIELESGYAVGHIAPKYVIDDLDDGLFRQAIERNTGKISKVLISKDEVSAAQRERMKMLAEKTGVEWEII